MGLLVDGEWKDQWYDTSDGSFKRSEAAFRNWIGQDDFPAESGRYHLYVSLACPWAHRALIFRTLKGLTEHIDVSAVHPLMLENGWEFGDDYEGATGDRLYGMAYTHQLYTKAMPDYSGRVTVPILWDKERETIVSNESSEIIRMFNERFGALASGPDFRPEALRGKIDIINARVYSNVNNGVYKTGFATKQDVYEDNLRRLFSALDWLEDILADNRYLCGDTITEADWRLFTTLVRFDKVYVGHFKCNIRDLREYPNLWAYTRELYQWPGVAETTNFDHIQHHYYASHRMINGSGVVPLGPEVNFWEPHGRG
jgi:putative glutathione S-transferase